MTTLQRFVPPVALSLALGVLACLPALAQYTPGPGEKPSEQSGLSPEVLGEIQGSLKMTPQLTAAQDALADHAIKDLVINRSLVNQTDRLFTHVIKNPGEITDQERSGRCWLFAGLNILRPVVIGAHDMKDFALSQAYDQFWDRLEHANFSLQLGYALRDEPLDSRKNQLLLHQLIGDGGDWTFVTALIDKYGVVPESLMPDTESASHTGTMDDLLSTRLRKAILDLRAAGKAGASQSKVDAIRLDALKDVYRILVLCLGQPPQSFTWRYETKDGKVSPYKTYTPQSFYKEFVGVDLSDYVRLVNYPGQPMNAKLEWAWYRGMADRPDLTAINVSAQTLSDLCAKSVLGDDAVWFASDAGAPGDRKAGLWADGALDYSGLFGMSFAMDKKDGLQTYDGAPNHAMVFTGVDMQGGKPDKWKVENSWGTKIGDKGWFIITSDWFGSHVYEAIINKKYVPADILKLEDQKPVVLPPWDPFSWD